MSRDIKGRRFCDACGRLTTTPHRVEGKDEFCGTCYKREFVKRSCACGASARVRRTMVGPVQCARCAAAARTCVRCDKPVPRAGRRVPGGVVCLSCRPYSHPPMPCERCGRASRALSLERDPESMRICERCAKRDTHATCAFCRRHRAIAGRTQEQRPYCAGCGPSGENVHECPGCGTSVRGGGSGQCRGCLNRRSLEREVALQSLPLTSPEGVRWMAGFARWLCDRDPPSTRLTKDFARHAPFIVRLDAILEAGDACSTAWFVKHIPLHEQRKHLLFMTYLREDEGIALSAKEKRRSCRTRARPRPTPQSSWKAVSASLGGIRGNIVCEGESRANAASVPIDRSGVLRVRQRWEHGMES